MRLFHGTTVESWPSIKKNGLKSSAGWGGAATEGVYLTNDPETAQDWGAIAWMREHEEEWDDHIEPQKFYRKMGKIVDDLVVVIAVDIPEDHEHFLRADMEQAEDFRFEGSDGDWEEALEIMGAVRYAGGDIPAKWLSKFSGSHGRY